ncbi:hypothetical protein KIV66_gp50 [Mycobacterium phage MyraDee]|uniref:Uncharacterized protein n=1 Tax=Mycobacterium phage MyraDee TaxID=2024303 RepID=A0A222YXZ1_9CAUD|nr:hypothetical protein KIV66_gp50 [Mycobacterium phage MyraDee]ASR77158.1 hypothetical protein SEA_MYRADEE_50 [Mycobacterium phage MyraDee]
MIEVRSPIHVQRVEYVYADDERASIDIKAWFPPSQAGLLVALAELDNAYDEARQKLAGYIERNT